MDNNNYDKFIADAARKYIELIKTFQKKEKIEKAFEKLLLMIEAEEKGLNPQGYKS